MLENLVGSWTVNYVVDTTGLDLSRQCISRAFDSFLAWIEEVFLFYLNLLAFQKSDNSLYPYDDICLN